jgi:hypothetical protein
MTVHFNESTVAAEPFGVGVKRQRLLTEARVPGTNILLDRWTPGPARSRRTAGGCGGAAGRLRK